MGRKNGTLAEARWSVSAQRSNHNCSTVARLVDSYSFQQPTESVKKREGSSFSETSHGTQQRDVETISRSRTAKGDAGIIEEASRTAGEIRGSAINTDW